MDHRPSIEVACSAVSAAKPGCCLALGGPSAPQGVATWGRTLALCCVLQQNRVTDLPRDPIYVSMPPPRPATHQLASFLFFLGLSSFSV